MSNSPKKILGISAYYHDSAAVLLIDGEIIAAAQEERFTRIKHTEEFPSNAIKYCLEESGLSIDDLDAVVYYEKPLLKFERLLQTYYSLSPSGIVSFLKAIPVWLNGKLFIKKRIREALQEIECYDKKKIKLLFSSHHLSHAASSFFCSNYEKAAIITIDGVGEWSTVSIGIGEGNSIKMIKEMTFPHSVGLLYSSFTYYLGFKVNSGEYKLMGLAPYGNKNSNQTKAFIDLIKTKLVDIKEDGSIWMNQEYFNYTSGLKMIKEAKWESLFGIKKRVESDEILQVHCDLAFAIQFVTEEIVIGLAQEAKKISGLSCVTMSGGVALNCVANAKLLEQNIFDEVYIQPASGDSGGALGAALAVYYMYYNQSRNSSKLNILKSSYLGPSYSNKEILNMAKKNKAVFKNISSRDELTKEVAELILKNKIVGWFQGRMEFGPRALGNRSILANPANEEMQKKLNLKIKNREGFRPFAPSVLAEDSNNYFDIDVKSPYMLFTAMLKENYRKKLPENYQNLSLWDKLYESRSFFPAITHIDFSARIQTVEKNSNPLFYNLLEKVKDITGNGILVNTSFNERGEPIVCSPQDAYNCFMRTEMDYLVIENFIFEKTAQPFWDNKELWGSVAGND
jgi:carbamoyltransferase